MGDDLDPERTDFQTDQATGEECFHMPSLAQPKRPWQSNGPRTPRLPSRIPQAREKAGPQRVRNGGSVNVVYGVNAPE